MYLFPYVCGQFLLVTISHNLLELWESFENILVVQNHNLSPSHWNRPVVRKIISICYCVVTVYSLRSAWTSFKCNWYIKWSYEKRLFLGALDMVIHSSKGDLRIEYFLLMKKESIYLVKNISYKISSLHVKTSGILYFTWQNQSPKYWYSHNRILRIP